MLVEPAKGPSAAAVLPATECSPEAEPRPPCPFMWSKSTCCAWCPPPPKKGSNSHHRPVDHTGLQQNVFIDEENVSPVLDNVKEKNNSIMRGHLLLGGCATQRENCLSNNVKTPPPPSLFCFEFSTVSIYSTTSKQIYTSLAEKVQQEM